VAIGLAERPESLSATTPVVAPAAAPGRAPVAFSPQADAPSCPECGSLMIRNGSCYKCLNCGATSGCS